MIKIKIGISSCLLGEEVRYNGGHKLSCLCVNTLSTFFDYQAVCPEVGIGLGVPRKPIHLFGDPKNPRAINVDNKNIDVTDRLIKFSEQTLPSLNRICGYIFIQGSPSCGLFKVKVYQKDNLPSEYSGRGIYAKAITNAMPLLPVEEAERLTDPILREHFIARVFIYHHWQMILQQGLNTAVILDVYASNKDRLMLHAPKTFIALGQLLKDVEKYEADEFKRKYIVVLLQALENHHKQ